MGKKSRFSARGKRIGVTGFGNGSKHGVFFNGKADKHIRNAKGYTRVEFKPDIRRHDVPTPTGRYRHRPWPLEKYPSSK